MSLVVVTPFVGEAGARVRGTGDGEHVPEALRPVPPLMAESVEIIEA